MNNNGPVNGERSQPYAFTHSTGGTSTSSDTGPSAGVDGSGSYYFVEASAPALEGDEFALRYSGGACDGGLVSSVTFHYHMYGSDMGELRVTTPLGAYPAAVFEALGEHTFGGSDCLFSTEGAAADLPLDQDPYTISAWIKADPSGANNGGIVGWGNYGTDDGVLAFRLGNSFDSLTTYWWGKDFSTPPLPPVSTTTSYTGCNDWGGSTIAFLDRHNAQCTYPAAMQKWRAANHGCGSTGEIEYVCTTPVYYGSTSTHETGCSDIGDGMLEYLDRFNSDCGAGKVMTQWHFGTPLPAPTVSPPRLPFARVRRVHAPNARQLDAVATASKWSLPARRPRS